MKAMDGPTWSMDLSFESDVLSRPPGKAMARDGGAPGKALLALRDAVGGTDLAKILALLTPSEAKSYQENWRSPAENLASAKEILDAQLPKQPKITGGELVADDHAVLEVEGVPYENGHMLYLVEMRLINGNWVYRDFERRRDVAGPGREAAPLKAAWLSLREMPACPAGPWSSWPFRTPTYLNGQNTNSEIRRLYEGHLPCRGKTHVNKDFHPCANATSISSTRQVAYVRAERISSFSRYG